MATYTYKVRNNVGEMINGRLEAASEQEALIKLRQQQYTPVKLALADVAVEKAEAKAAVVPVRKVEVRDLTLFCINLSSMVSAGIPLLGALNVTSGQLTNLYLGDIVRRAAQEVSEGVSFSKALEKYPKVFSRFFVNMIRVAEMSGTLEGVLKTLSIYLEQQDNLRQKIQGALIYPMILIVAGTFVILLILTFVMPQFVTIFTKSGVPLPAPTRILNNIGVWMRSYWYLVFIVIGAIIFAVRKGLETPTGRDLSQRLMLRLPLFGPVTKDILVARFCRTLGSLIHSGVPLLQALNILSEVIDNVVFYEIIREVHASAEKGEGVHKALSARPEFPKDVVYMISVGEETGKMGQMLHKVADFYENKVEFAVKGLLVFIEPVFICVLGVCVGGMLASVILPMFDMIKTIRH